MPQYVRAPLKACSYPVLTLALALLSCWPVVGCSVHSECPANLTRRVRKVGGEFLLKVMVEGLGMQESEQNINMEFPTILLLHSSSCPNSLAFKPVYDCLTGLFPKDLTFFSFDIQENASATALLAFNIRAIPTILVILKGRRHRYQGAHSLVDVMDFIARATSTPALLSIQEVHECLSDPESCGWNFRCATMEGEATHIHMQIHWESKLLRGCILFLGVRMAIYILWNWKWMMQLLHSRHASPVV